MDIIYPKYEYTFEVINIFFERAQIEVLYKPVDVRFTNFAYTIPIHPDIDVNDLKPMVENYAPYDRWFAQEIILSHENTLLGATG